MFNGVKRDAPGAYRLDMTEARFKNSRARTPLFKPAAIPTNALTWMRHIPPSPGFYGPSVTSISSLIAPALDEYVQLVAFEFEDKPYVFCTRDATRCQTSSAWSAYCKGIFKKWSGVACPPKILVRPLHSLASPLHFASRAIDSLDYSVPLLSLGSALRKRRPKC